jgi:hypothetical protein
MRKHPRVSGRPSVDVCLCSPTLGSVCSLHRASRKPVAPLADRFSLVCPWNPDELPDHLKGYGHHTSWSLCPDGEWIFPEEDKEAEFFRTIEMLFEATRIKPVGKG